MGDAASAANREGSRIRSWVNHLIDRVDLLQRRRVLFGFPVGVVKRYREDRGPDFAALLSYYGFFSIFPLLLVLITVLGLVLEIKTGAFGLGGLSRYRRRLCGSGNRIHEHGRAIRRFRLLRFVRLCRPGDG